MSQIRACVIGGGHLGTIHTRLLSGIESVYFVGVAEPRADARQRLSDQFQVETVADYRELLGQIDAAVVAAPTRFHHDITLDLLQHGVHVLVEKPLTSTVAQAQRLVAEAHARRCVLQVGHVERFSPVFAAAKPQLGAPRFIEAERSGPYSFRSTDIGVVHDLMIHDIDLVLSLVDSTLIDVAAVGATVIGPHEDIAQARLQFADGCVANLTASRVSPEPRREMRVVCDDIAARLDFVGGKVEIMRPNAEILEGRLDVDSLSADQVSQMKERLFQDYLAIQELPVESTNAILDEQRDFISAVESGTPVRVDGRQATQALLVAQRILNSLERHTWTRSGAEPTVIATGFQATPHRKAG